jgi:N4-gp56 family major capsid protein
MVDGTTTYGDISQRTAAWAAVEMLAHAEPTIVLGKFAKQKPVPMNTANVVKFRRPIPFPAATTPLVEGVTPTPQKMLYEDVQATLQQYGATTEITDVVRDTSEDPVLKDATMLMGEQAGETLEAVLYGVMKAGTSVTYANGTARTDVNTPMTLSVQRSITRSLKSQKAKKISRMLSSSPNYGTKAIEPAYIAFSHTNVEGDIRNINGFIPVADYGQRSPLCEEELGSAEDVRYILSADLDGFADAGGAEDGSGESMMSTGGTSADVFPVVFVGRESYASVPLKGKQAITPMIVNAKPSAADPMAQRTYVSWKTYYAGVRLNENWMHRAEVAASQNP